MADTVLDMSDVPEKDQDVEDLRVLDRLMRDRFTPDVKARAELIPVLRGFAEQARLLYRLATGLRAGEISRFDSALETASTETGINTDYLDVDASPDLANVWALLYEVGDSEATLLGHAESAELLAAFLADDERIQLTPRERAALDRERLYALRRETAANLRDALALYRAARRTLMSKADDPDPGGETGLLADMLSYAKAIRLLRDRIDDIDRRLDAARRRPDEKDPAENRGKGGGS